MTISACDNGVYWLLAAIGILAFGAFAAVAIGLYNVGKDAMRWPE